MTRRANQGHFFIIPIICQPPASGVPRISVRNDVSHRRENTALRLVHEGATIWDTLAIAEYLNEVRPQARLLPEDRIARAHCRAICGEMHSGFSAMRAALPMNLRVHRSGFKVWSRAQSDIDRITAIWRECLSAYGGPYLFGARTMADAMYAPVVTRFRTYEVKLDVISEGYCRTIMALPDMLEWMEAAGREPEEIDELDMEF